MAKHIIKFYPVANGDTTLIKLSDFTTLLIDCKIRSKEQEENGYNVFDVKKDLITEVRRHQSNPFIDCFILTHPDQDHCLGFQNHFYCGDPDAYDKANRDNDEIVVNEMWVTSSLFNDANNDDAKKLKEEAERRLSLWKNDAPSKSKDGNRIRMIGYDGDDRFENVPNSIPGDVLTLEDINGNTEGIMEIFIHGPFKKSLIDSQAITNTNSTSIIAQFRFREDSSSDWCAYFLTGGDADHYRWEQALNKSKEHDNEDRLLWDIFQTPHHCSWSFFNDVPYEDEQNREAKKSSLELLDFGRSSAFIVASSKKIVEAKPNPPHNAAKKEYLKKIKVGHFLNTDTNHKESDPRPIVFEISGGKLKRTDSGKDNSAKLAAAAGLACTSVGSGNWSI